MDIRAVQAALKARGYALGSGGPAGDGVDGFWGVLSRAALDRFRRERGLPPGDGPDAPALRALGLPAAPAPPPPWFAEAGRRMGLDEVRDNAALRAFLASDGRALGDPKVLPWCGDFAQTCMALTLPGEPMVANPYWAANWGRFGVPLATPAPGAVLVFTRAGGGHVGFYAGERRRDGALLVRGGNQSNAVTEAFLAASRLGAVRWPRTYPLPPAGRVHVRDDGRPLSTQES